MVMKFNESKLLILLASIILGFLLASQMNFGKLLPREMVTLQNFQQMSQDYRKATDEINILNKKRIALESKISEYKNSGPSTTETIDKLSDELNKHEFDIGLADVEGPGVIVSVADSPEYGIYRGMEGDESFLVHDTDILLLIGELRNAGAEAISVNDQRIIYNTAIYCGGSVIFVNGLELVPPYIIKVIGNPDSLIYALNNNDGWYKWMEARGLQVSFRREEGVKVLKYDGNLKYFYMNPVKSN
jgi:uncharacterized protein YlxW (UPF0749 family)